MVLDSKNTMLDYQTALLSQLLFLNELNELVDA